MKLFEKKMFRFYCLYFVTYFAQAISYCLLVSFLASLGYTATQRSIFFVFDALCGMLVQFVVGYLCDKYLKIKPFIYGVYVIYMIATFMVYRTTEINFYFHLFFVGCLGSMLRVTTGLTDSLTLETGEEFSNNFGIIRAFGSIGWAIGAPIVAIIVEKFGYEALGISFLISLVVLYVVYNGISDVKKERNKDAVSIKDVKILLSNKTYSMMVVMLLFFFIADASQGYTVVNKILYLNGTDKQIGFYWSFMAILELPLFFTAGKIIEKVGALKMTGIAGVFFVIRYVIYGLSTNMTHIFIAAAFQAVTFPILIVTSRMLIEQESREKMKTTGQQVAMALYSGGSALIAPYVFGVMEDSIGINYTLYSIAGVAVIACVMCLVLQKNTKKGK